MNHTQLPSDFLPPAIYPSLLSTLSIPGSVPARYIPPLVVNARVSLEDLKLSAKRGEIIWKP